MTTTEFGKVAVLMGGTSAERDVSLKSGRAVLEALLRKGIDAHGIDVQGQLVEQIQTGNYDRVFIVLHGRGGEDGGVQGMLECLGIPYTGSGVLGSSLSMDKIRTKQIWQACGIPTPQYAVLNRDSDFIEIAATLGLPMAVKPVREGSSLGTIKVTDASSVKSAWEQASQYDENVMAEPWIEGKEYTAAILGDEVLPLIRLETERSFYDYEAKYNSDDTRYFCPSGLDASKEEELKAVSLKAFKALGAYGWGRIDILCDKQGKAYLLENNTVPGMTDHSLVPMAAKHRGYDFDELVIRILQQTL